MTITTAGCFTRDAPIAERIIAIIAGLPLVGHTIAAARQLATASASIGGFVIISITVITSFNLKPQSTIATTGKDTIDAGIARLVIAIVAALVCIGDTIATGGQPTAWATGVRSIIVVGFPIITGFHIPPDVTVAAAGFCTGDTAITIVVVGIITGFTHQGQDTVPTAGRLTGIGAFIPRIPIAVIAGFAWIDPAITATFPPAFGVAAITRFDVAIIAGFDAVV